jgi:hypothetical protein
MEIYAFRKRAFLNPPSANQTISLLMSSHRLTAGTSKARISVFLGDCEHTIMLEFFLGTKHRRRASLAKIDLLLDVLTEFRDALKREIELIENAARPARPK